MRRLWYKAEKLMLKAFRRTFFKSKSSKKAEPMRGEDLNALIRSAIESGKPFMVARFGSIELDSALYPYILSLPLVQRYKLFLKRRIPFIHKDDNYAESLIVPLCNNAGFFPNDISLLNRFSDIMVNDTRVMDCCCRCDWEDEGLLSKEFMKSIAFARLEDMEPYDYAQPWSKALEGKKVLIIHPFAKSIESQYSRKEKIWENHDVLPDFELKTIKAVQTIAGEPSSFGNWFEALDYMKGQMDSLDYDVAIIGCGAYGFPLAAHAKRTGHAAIHLGGATQILFGIKGKRWEEIPAVSKFFNEYWVTPSEEETPKNNAKVENGCYW